LYLDRDTFTKYAKLSNKDISIICEYVISLLYFLIICVFAIVKVVFNSVLSVVLMHCATAGLLIFFFYREIDSLPNLQDRLTMRTEFANNTICFFLRKTHWDFQNQGSVPPYNKYF